MSANLVTLTDVHVELGGTPILRGITASIRRGRITALLGLNGSGKTTLLRALIKEIPYRGQILFHCGHDHRHPTPQHVGYVPQKLRIEATLPLTVRDLLALGLQTWPLFLGVRRSVVRRLPDILQRVGITNPAVMLERMVENLSGGELQRVLMALALEPNPELLLLDEPAAGVDFRDQEPFYNLIARLNAETGVTVLLVSHDLSVVTRHAHHVLCMNNGRIECEGQPTEVVSGDFLQRVFGTAAGLYLHRHPA